VLKQRVFSRRDLDDKTIADYLAGQCILLIGLDHSASSLPVSPAREKHLDNG